jgi:hypothetical protein
MNAGQDPPMRTRQAQRKRDSIPHFRDLLACQADVGGYNELDNHFQLMKYA